VAYAPSTPPVGPATFSSVSSTVYLPNGERRSLAPTPWKLIRRSLESVHGCDKNPFAASIARFRLLVVVLRSAGVSRLDQASEFPINIAVGDSLIHGGGIQLKISEEPHTYVTEDVNEFVRSCNLLGRSSYHVVVGNPPYITVKDKNENQNYRVRYSACSGAYALSVPFAQRLFQLAIRTSGNERNAGYIGQITANSFMKREFGKKLIEDFFRPCTLPISLTPPGPTSLATGHLQSSSSAATTLAASQALSESSSESAESPVGRTILPAGGYGQQLFPR
jgi:hypothetical protein